MVGLLHWNFLIQIGRGLEAEGILTGVGKEWGRNVFIAVSMHYPAWCSALSVATFTAG